MQGCCVFTLVTACSSAVAGVLPLVFVNRAPLQFGTGISRVSLRLNFAIVVT